MPPVRLVWYDGGLKPPAPAELKGQPLGNDGVLYIGDKGKMLEAKILSESTARKSQDIPKTLPRRGGTWIEWFQACKGGEAAGCNFDWAVPLTETVLLGNIIQQQFGFSRDWPFGSAIACLAMVIVMFSLWLFARFAGEEGRKELL